jgi:hypothetical protein
MNYMRSYNISNFVQLFYLSILYIVLFFYLKHFTCSLLIWAQSIRLVHAIVKNFRSLIQIRFCVCRFSLKITN